MKLASTILLVLSTFFSLTLSAPAPSQTNTGSSPIISQEAKMPHYYTGSKSWNATGSDKYVISPSVGSTGFASPTGFPYAQHQVKQHVAAGSWNVTRPNKSVVGGGNTKAAGLTSSLADGSNSLPADTAGKNGGPQAKIPTESSTTPSSPNIDSARPIYGQSKIPNHQLGTSWNETQTEPDTGSPGVKKIAASTGTAFAPSASGTRSSLFLNNGTSSAGRVNGTRVSAVMQTVTASFARGTGIAVSSPSVGY